MHQLCKVYLYAQEVEMDYNWARLMRDQIKSIVFRYIFIYYNCIKISFVNPGGLPRLPTESGKRQTRR